MVRDMIHDPYVSFLIPNLRIDSQSEGGMI